MHKLLIFTLLTLAHSNMNAQESGVLIDNLKSLRVEMDGQWDSDPVGQLGSGHFVEISFDDLQHNYVRYTYHITHCNADWTPSDLLESDYMEGFNGSRIENYEPSMNTTMAATLCTPWVLEMSYPSMRLGSRPIPRISPSFRAAPTVRSSCTVLRALRFPSASAAFRSASRIRSCFSHRRGVATVTAEPFFCRSQPSSCSAIPSGSTWQSTFRGISPACS